MTSNMPVWLPGVSIVVIFLGVGVLISLHPSLRNRYRGRPAAPGQPTLFQRRPRGPGVMSTDVGGLLHFKAPAIWWLGVVLWVLFLLLALVQVSVAMAVPVTAAGLLVAVLAYLRPKRAVQSCYVDQNGAITLIRGDVRIPFDLTQYRYIRMYRRSRIPRWPTMVVLYRDTQPTSWTWLGSVLFPRVDGERVVLLFNRWWDADGYFVGPRDMAALFFQACVRAGRTPTEEDKFFGWNGWEVRPEY